MEQICNLEEEMLLTLNEIQARKVLHPTLDVFCVIVLFFGCEIVKFCFSFLILDVASLINFFMVMDSWIHMTRFV